MIVAEVVKGVAQLALQAMASFDLVIKIRDEEAQDVVDLVSQVIQVSAQHRLRLKAIRICPFERQTLNLDSRPGFNRITANALELNGILIVDCEECDGAVTFCFSRTI